MELLLKKFILENKDWEYLLTSAPYYLNISRKDGYILFKYNQMMSDFSNPIVKEARGIIFRESDLKCVCYPFTKFMNADEPNSDLDKLDWSSIKTQEKIDGSLLKAWYDEGSWHISTNGTIDASQATVGEQSVNSSTRTFRDIFDLALTSAGISFDSFTKLLDVNYTYMFELVSPYNRIVINYDTTELYFIGVRDMISGKELNPRDFTSLTKYFKCPKEYDLHTLEAIRDAANKLNSNNVINDEGFVLVDKYFNRVKVKSMEYVKAHHLSNNGAVTIERLINVILKNETSEFLTYCPMYKDRIEDLAGRMDLFKSEVTGIIRKMKESQPDIFSNRKEYAEVVKTYDKRYQSFLFRHDNLDDAFSRLTPAKWKDLLNK